MLEIKKLLEFIWKYKKTRLLTQAEYQSWRTHIIIIIIIITNVPRPKESFEQMVLKQKQTNKQTNKPPLSCTTHKILDVSNP